MSVQRRPDKARMKDIMNAWRGKKANKKAVMKEKGASKSSSQSRIRDSVELLIDIFLFWRGDRLNYSLSLTLLRFPSTLICMSLMRFLYYFWLFSSNKMEK
ncbi:hypothetical protein CEXT_125801 [Caerostris extrusa]|uniref:Uncharacterized protein n=1 Tax=Caerostris extrusa TaxID=172846 RepID=A0AAV4V7M3_CAEEX|nr:hypothetical protein CEXT_125801 [Caerostris extrusa]